MHAKTNMTKTCSEQSESNRNSYYDYTREGKFTPHGKLKKVISVFVLMLSCIFFISSITYATTYYIDKSNGIDTNSGSQNAPWKTIGKANSTLVAGDTVYIRAGTYNETINPTNSGSSGNRITYIAYTGETVTIDSVYDGADLRSKDYITIDGFTFTTITHYWINLRTTTGDSIHNTIKNCTMTGSTSQTGWAGIYIDKSSYTIVRNCTMTSYCSGVGANGGPDDLISLVNSSYCLIEDNTFGNAPHDAVGIREQPSTATVYNIIRNNTFQNKWHTQINMWQRAHWTLIDGNTILDAGEDHLDNYCGEEGDRTMTYHSAIKVASEDVIIRRNVCDNNGHNVMSVNGAGASNALRGYWYHNTFYKMGDYGIPSQPASGQDVKDNVLKNNIFRSSGVYEWYEKISGDDTNYWTYNDILGVASPIYFGGSARTVSYMETNLPSEWSDNLEVDPEFVDTGNRDFNLQSSSPMIDAGGWLTTITSATGSGTSFVVDDAHYFIDGWGIVTGDTIQLQGQANPVTITKINYTTNTITVNTSVSWTQGDGVALPYNGSAPDIGAYEYGGTTPPPTTDTEDPTTPANLTATAVSSSQVNLSWNASTDPVVTGQATSGVAGYKIYRDGIQIATTFNTSYSNIGLSPSTTYPYTVSAYDVAGNESGQSSPISATTLIATASLANSNTMVANSGNFAVDREVYRLWDGITNSGTVGSSGAGNIASFWVEFDFGQNYDLTSAQLFGDADNNWVSNTWNLQYKQNISNPWNTAFSNVDAFFNGWSSQSLAITARYVSVEVFGNPVIPATQARELEIYGTPSSGDIVPPTPPIGLLIQP